MAHSSVSTSETLRVVEELMKMFSDNYSGREKLKVLISNIASAQSLFLKLRSVIVKYEKHGENIDEHINFLNQLKKFKILIEENLIKSIQNHDITLIIGDYLSAIREDYKLIRNYVQTLDEINQKIKKQISNGKNKKKIGDLIIRGVEDKIPNFIYLDQKNHNDDEKKSEIMKTFYKYFIDYISFIREALENMLNDNNYRIKLENLQSKLLNTKSLDIKDYFSEIKSKIIDDRGYSTEILLENLAKNPIVHSSIANSSDFYCDIFINILKTTTDKKCIGSLTILIYKLDESGFVKLNRQIFENKLSIDLVFKTIYDKGIELWLNEPIINPTSIKNRIINYFKPTSLNNLDQLRKKIDNLFMLILSENLNIQFRDVVIDEKNSIGTYNLLSDIYGQRIKNLDFSDDIINVKYCLNRYFFLSLEYSDLDDVNGFDVFAKLLFYIHTYDDDDDDKLHHRNTHKDSILKLKRKFSKVYNVDNRENLNDLVEILKVMINIQSYNFRLDCVEKIISKLENNEELNVKIEVLKIFLDTEIYGSEICLRLAQSFNIHLIKCITNDKDKIKTDLCNYNPNFESVIKHLDDLNMKFDVDDEVSPGFSIPYYLSAKLATDKRYNSESDDYDVENNQIVMSILFKVFTCSTDRDKEEFLKNKNDINNEFVKLFESVNRLIKFYNTDNNNEINQKLRDVSIQCILNGFSEKNDESLKQRNDFARIIIDNFINYKLEHITKIVQSSSQNEIFNLFDIIMKRKNNDNLREWAENTSKLKDKIYFLYCYHQYPENEFNQWYQELNSNSSYERIDRERKIIKEDFHENIKAFDLINIKYLQHNQVGALALINDYLKDPLKNQNNLFIKIGTGQGKSLTIAETARKIIQMNRNAHKPKQQVFIITCYDHLAKRDHENYHIYYRYFDIKSMHCSSNSSTRHFYDKDVIYSDL
ncbi:unnamed protein product, partial [Rotaria sordida]